MERLGPPEWLDAIGSSRLDLGPEAVGGIPVSDTLITVKHYPPATIPPGTRPPGSVFRNSCTSLSPDHFTGTAELSTDGKHPRTEVTVIESSRVKD